MNTSDKLRLLADDASTLLANVRVPAIFLLEIAKELEKKAEVEFEISKESHDYLKDLAKERGCSIDEVMNDILKEYLDEIEKRDENK